ncbi:MAG: hypothetical protein M1814_006827 [Vezdaea aestivalis]|nr:MAG: hypothetical protein M1814_006827 [Vezdaea aestivalis]
MAEAFAIVSGVAGLLTLTIEVYSTSARYISGVRGASTAAQDLLRELKALKKILSDLDDLLEYTEGEEVFRDRPSSLLSTEECDEYREVLERLQSKLQNRGVGGSFKAKLKTLAWPLTEEKTRRTVELLQRHVQIFQNALSIDTLSMFLALGSHICPNDMQLSNYSYYHSVTTTEILRIVGSTREDFKAGRASYVLDWLSPLDMHQKQLDILAKRDGNSGQWLLEHADFLEWAANDRGSVLWCPGDPGSGKTVMTSIVLDHLTRQTSDTDSAVAFLYCDYQDQNNQTATKLIASLIKQLVIIKESAMEALQELHQNLSMRQEKPSFGSLEPLLMTVCNKFSKTILVIDALDECSLQERKLLLPTLEKLQREGCRLFVTSRPHAPDICRAFDGQSKIIIKATDLDITNYITSKIAVDEDLSDILDDDPQLRQEVIDSISIGSGGMFLIAVLQIRRICDQMTRREVRRALENMPISLSEMYEATLERITSQSTKRRQLGLKILGWISHAKRPLLIDELCHGLAVEYVEGEPRPPTMDTENILRRHMILDVCAGLVVIEEESQVVRLVHYTTQEYFMARRNTLFLETDAKIAGTCLTYLLFDTFKEGPCPYPELTNRLEKFRFLEYASCYWGHHVRESLELKFMDWILELLQNDNSICSSAQALERSDRWFFYWCNQFGFAPKDFRPLQAAASQGLTHVLEKLLEAKHDLSESDGTFKTPAHWASKTGHMSSLQLLMSKGASVNARSKDNFTLLDVACEYGHESIVKMLLEQGCDINTKGFGGSTALSTSARMGKEKIVQYLLQLGADWNTVTDYGESPLFLAALTGRDTLVELFIELGSDVHSKNECGNSIIHAAAYFGHSKVVALLLDAGADINAKSASQETPLFLACCQGHSDVIELLVQRGADLSAKSAEKMMSFAPLVGKIGHCVPQMVTLRACVAGGTALLEAAFHGDLATVERLVSLGADVDTLDSFHRSALLVAAEGERDAYGTKADHLGVVKLLLTEGANINAQNDDDESPLMLASFTGNIQMVQLILDNGADIEAEDVKGRTALVHASMVGNVDVAHLLIKAGAKIEPGNGKATPLMVAAGRGGPAMVLSLLEAGSDLNARSSDGLQAIHWAVVNNKLDSLKVLVEKGSAIEARTSDEKTPLMVSARFGALECVEYLLQMGADVATTSKGGATALIQASSCGHSEVITMLLAKGADINQAADGNVLPLVEAAHTGMDEAAGILIEHGAQIDAADSDGCTALLDAAKNGHLSTVKLLVEKGANLEMRDRFGRTPLLAAAIAKMRMVVEYLMNAGASYMAASNFGDTASPCLLALVRDLVQQIDPTLSPPSDLDESDSDSSSVILIPSRRTPVDDTTLKPLDRLKQLLSLPSVSGDMMGGAAMETKTNFVKVLIEARADINGKNRRDNTALILATKSEREEVVKYLLEQSADPNITDKSHRTPLYWAVLKGYSTITKLLLENGADPSKADEDLETPLNVAIDSRDTDSALLLIEYGANISLAGDDLLTPIHWAFRRSLEPVITKLLEKGANINTPDIAGRTPIHFAADADSLELLELLVSLGADVNSTSKSGDTPLHPVAHRGNLETARFLLRHGADVNAERSPSGSPINGAAHMGHTEMIALFLEHGASIEAPTMFGATPLLMAAKVGNIDSARLLIDKGANIFTNDHGGGTVLMSAALNFDEIFVSELIEKGVDFRAATTTGRTALHFAVDGHNEPVVKLLLSKGVDVHAREDMGFTPLHRACVESQGSIVKLLLEDGKADPNRGNDTGCPPSHYAARGRLPALKALIEGEADPDGSCGHKSTPLLLSAELGHTDVVEYLLDTGRVDINGCDDDGDSAILMSATQGHADIVGLLLKQKGLDVLQPNKKGETAVSNAIKRQRWPVLGLLGQSVELDKLIIQQIEEGGFTMLGANREAERPPRITEVDEDDLNENIEEIGETTMVDSLYIFTAVLRTQHENHPAETIVQRKAVRMGELSKNSISIGLRKFVAHFRPKTKKGSKKGDNSKKDSEASKQPEAGASGNQIPPANAPAALTTKSTTASTPAVTPIFSSAPNGAGTTLSATIAAIRTSDNTRNENANVVQSIVQPDQAPEVISQGTHSPSKAILDTSDTSGTTTSATKPAERSPKGSKGNNPGSKHKAAGEEAVSGNTIVKRDGEKTVPKPKPDPDDDKFWYYKKTPVWNQAVDEWRKLHQKDFENFKARTANLNKNDTQSSFSDNVGDWLTKLEPADKTPKQATARLKRWQPILTSLRGIAMSAAALDPNKIAPIACATILFHVMNPEDRDKILDTLCQCSNTIMEGNIFEITFFKASHPAVEEDIIKMHELLKRQYLTALTLACKIRKRCEDMQMRFASSDEYKRSGPQRNTFASWCTRRGKTLWLKMSNKVLKWEGGLKELSRLKSEWAVKKDDVKESILLDEHTVTVRTWLRKKKYPDPSPSTIRSRVMPDDRYSNGADWFLEGSAFRTFCAGLSAPDTADGAIVKLSASGDQSGNPAAPANNSHDSNVAKRVLWLRGGLGTGKTTVLSLAFADLSTFGGSVSENESMVRVVPYFCNGSEIGTKRADWETILRAMIRRMALQPDGTLAEAANKVYLKHGSAASDEDLTVKEHWDPLFNKLLTSAGNGCYFVFLVDALDECDKTKDWEDLLKFMKQIIESYSNVSFICSSHSHVEVDKFFQDKAQESSIVVIEDVDSGRNSKALEAYINGEIQRREPDAGKSVFYNPDFKGLKDELRDTLLCNARGVFQWVKVWLDILLATVDTPRRAIKSDTNAREWLDRLKKDSWESATGYELFINGYQRLWDITCIREHDDFKQRARLFHFVFAANCRPTVQLLSIALRIRNVKLDRYPQPEAKMPLCSNFLHLNAETEDLEFVHSSAQNFVRGLNMQQDKLAEGDEETFFSDHPNHESVARLYIDLVGTAMHPYWTKVGIEIYKWNDFAHGSSEGRSIIRNLEDIGKWEATSDDVLVAYFVRYGLAHFRQAARKRSLDDPIWKEFIQRLVLPSDSAFGAFLLNMSDYNLLPYNCNLSYGDNRKSSLRLEGGRLTILPSRVLACLPVFDEYDCVSPTTISTRNTAKAHDFLELFKDMCTPGGNFQDDVSKDSRLRFQSRQPIEANALHLACIFENPGAVRAILYAAKLLSPDKLNEMLRYTTRHCKFPLDIAIHRPNFTIASLLLEADRQPVRVNAESDGSEGLSFKYTSLQWDLGAEKQNMFPIIIDAVETLEDEEMLSLLKVAGPECIDAEYEDGTPLYCAIVNKKYKLARALVKDYGADKKRAVDKHGKTPFEPGMHDEVLVFGECS